MALYFPSACMLFPSVDRLDGQVVKDVKHYGSLVYVELADGAVRVFDQYERVPVDNPQQVPDDHPQAGSLQWMVDQQAAKAVAA